MIDPQLVYATYLGGGGHDPAAGIAVDSAGSVYVTGLTQSIDFPMRNPLQETKYSGQNAFVTKLSPDGSSLVYSTYISGGEGFGINSAEGTGIAVDTTGAVYITGNVEGNFPTKNPIHGSNRGGQDAFVLKLSPDGASLVYSTYLGGSGKETVAGITLDSSNAAFVFGQTNSTDFPTMNATQATYGGGDSDGFWAVINAQGSSLLFSTYQGGNGDDSTAGCVIDAPTGDVYVSSLSDSTDFLASNSSSIAPSATIK